MCKYKKWDIKHVNKFTAYANNDGDYIQLRTTDVEGNPLPYGMIYLEVGHCCVHICRAIIPLELLTSMIDDGTDDGDLRRVMKSLWPTEYGKELADKIVYLDGRE